MMTCIKRISYCLLILLSVTSSAVMSSDLSSLTIMGEEYPKSIYFRNAENSAANETIPYEKWKNRWSKLDGMVVKVLDEEIPGRSGEAQKKFLKYKQEFPQKMMLLHFNGNARDPRFDLDAFKHHDWTYFVGTDAQGKITSSPDATDIKVNNTDVFKQGWGRGNKGNDDIAIVTRTTDGKLNWERVEQVKLVSINKKQSSITVARGQFNTKPLSFDKGKAYLAPHVAQAPFAKGSEQSLWRYNFTQLGSKADYSQSMAQALADNLLSYMSSDGPLSSFDGIEFDVLADYRGFKHQSRKDKIDYNFDGKFSSLDNQAADNYRIGVRHFLTQLRHKLGDNKLLLADGNELNQQREFGLLNGIESETWPSHWDPEIEQWSSGMNRHLFWNDNCYSPCFSYIKLGELPSKKGSSVAPTENTRKLRVAAALIMDATIAPAYRPKGKKIDNWPELTGGKRNYNSWLGKVISPPMYYKISDNKPKNCIIVNDKQNFSVDESSEKVKIIKRIGTGTLQFSCHFSLASADDVVLVMQTKSKSTHLTPRTDQVRYISIVPNEDQSQENMTWSGNNVFESRFYFKQLKAGLNNLQFESDAEEIHISDLSITSGAEVMYREFENGLVIANPFRKPILLDIADFTERKNLLIDNRKYEKKDTITIKAKDAIFIKYKDMI
ncbi:hypothetical protein [Shewanella sp. 6_MG-2023]|uniref:hypothetical protein n=1 Tax=Shewanella sp. 6_MG-2023 TaxID=3062660 RepID=UPI0026E49096|nr:hypothetical protein [Shewanella sp. 6_MG-2023]MDO6617640.1 hypothetical protein [Shewanella sp. 6_MG-2023]